MSIEIRPLATAEEVNAGFRVFLRAMAGLPFAELDAVPLTDPGRYLGAFDGDAVVGGADSYGGWLTVPGGAKVPHAAVTHVGVLPTHRRQGLVRELVTRQLRDLADRGEVLASLRASEAVIYERFGYGVASAAQSARVSRRRAELRPGVPAGGRIRLVDREVTTDLLAGIYDRAGWTGAVSRPVGWWRLQELLRAKSAVPQYVVVHSTDGFDDGYAIYQPEDTAGWFTSPEKVITVTDLVAHSDAARAGIWRHLLSLDLVDVVAFGSLALDDPLPLAVLDQRSVSLGGAHDETWLRLLDVEAALQARVYGEADPVVVGISDELLPANVGRYEIGPKGVARTGAEPDLEVDVATLGAVYLGGTRWQHLAATGRVEVRTPGAVARADDLFATEVLPYAGTVF
jgi:predicted acetyltransferase